MNPLASFSRLSLSSTPQGGGSPMVMVSPSIKIEPPIPLSDTLQGLSVLPSPSNPAASNAGNADLLAFRTEHELLDKGPTDFVEKAMAEGRVKTWQDPDISQFLEMGISRNHAALGVAYVKQAQVNQSEVVEFATHLNQLAQMGFSTATAAGALALSKNNVNIATELCLMLK